jgi:hypothetical protein
MEHTKRLHVLLQNLSKIHLLLQQGLYIGEASKLHSEVISWVESTHSETMTQFLAQPDHKLLEPNLGLGGISGI